jgi:hypothetical protein
MIVGFLDDGQPDARASCSTPRPLSGDDNEAVRALLRIVRQRAVRVNADIVCFQPYVDTSNLKCVKMAGSDL